MILTLLRNVTKIPDNTHGDNNIVLAINEEYERLLRFYLGT